MSGHETNPSAAISHILHCREDVKRSLQELESQEARYVAEEVYEKMVSETPERITRSYTQFLRGLIGRRVARILQVVGDCVLADIEMVPCHAIANYIFGRSREFSRPFSGGIPQEALQPVSIEEMLLAARLRAISKFRWSTIQSLDDYAYDFGPFEE